MKFKEAFGRNEMDPFARRGKSKARAKLVAEATVVDGLGNIYIMLVFDDGTVRLTNEDRQNFALSNANFRGRGGYAKDAADIKRLALSAKNSDDLAEKLNDSGMGWDNWEGVEVNNEIF